LLDKRSLLCSDEEDERNLNYNPPAQKSLEEIQDWTKRTRVWSSTSRPYLSVPNVQVTRLTLLCDTAPEPITMDLTGDLNALKEKTFILKEGVTYRLKIDFKVNREIVSGLKYHHVTCRKGITVEKVSHMVGSYGPKEKEHESVGPLDEAPIGMMSRGHYQVKSRFIDDDKIVYLAWDWNLDIKKDWD
uniref:Rho GDP dissociation inhibitor (GDI) gamma n=1 Tax=Labrus bergylta TaxID=56723 RepID=A0A3Q3FPK9_9LABR